MMQSFRKTVLQFLKKYNLLPDDPTTVLLDIVCFLFLFFGFFQEYRGESILIPGPHTSKAGTSTMEAHPWSCPRCVLEKNILPDKICVSCKSLQQLYNKNKSKSNFHQLVNKQNMTYLYVLVIARTSFSSMLQCINLEA